MNIVDKLTSKAPLEGIEISVEGDQIIIYYNENSISITGSISKPMWIIKLKLSLNCDINYLQSTLNTNYNPVIKSLIFYNSILHEFLTYNSLYLKEFYYELNKKIISEILQDCEKSKKIVEYSTYEFQSIFKIYDVFTFTSSSYERTGKDTITNSSTSIKFENNPTRHIPFTKNTKYDKIVDLIGKLYKYQSTTDYSYSRAGDDEKWNATMYNYQLTNIANKMYYNRSDINDNDFKILENLIKTFSFSIEYVGKNPIWSHKTIKSLRNSSAIWKLGIDRVLFLKFVIFCLYDSYEKLKINNIFFWNHAYFLIKNNYFYQKYSNDMDFMKFYKANQQQALNNIYAVLTDNILLIDETLQKIMHQDLFEDVITDYIEHTVEHLQFSISNVLAHFNNLKKK